MEGLERFPSCVRLVRTGDVSAYGNVTSRVGDSSGLASARTEV